MEINKISLTMTKQEEEVDGYWSALWTVLHLLCYSYFLCTCYI